MATLQAEQVVIQQAAVQQVAALPAHVDGHVALMEELLSYRERCGDHLHGGFAANVAPQGVLLQQDAQPVVEPRPYLPPPPPPPSRHHQGPSYWCLLRQKREMRLEMFRRSVDATPWLRITGRERWRGIWIT